MDSFIKKLPKAELHLHIEGTLEPELLFKIARRNAVKLKYKSINDLKAAYQFNKLQDFLDIYYEGTKVLLQERDFYDLTLEYLKKARHQNILHCEIFFDPQSHTSRGIKFSTVVNGIDRARQDARKKYGLSSRLIMCFLRDLSVTSAMQTLKQALPHKNKIVAVGLDSAEVGNPPAKFKKVFDYARRAGFLTVAHAGEEGSAEYIWEALRLLKVSRIDHGNHCLDDVRLVKELVQRKIPLTVCPLSNLKLKVVQNLTSHPLKLMLNRGLLVTVNSDDPAYFGGYINDNYSSLQKALKLNRQELYILARNSFAASFLGSTERKQMILRLNSYMRKCA